MKLSISNSTETRRTAQGAPRTQSRVVRNVLSNWGGYLFSVILTFFLSPFVVNHLGATAYGVWILLVSLTGYLGLLDLGVRGAVTRYVAKFYAREEHNDAGGIVSSALGIFAVAGIVAMTISIGLATFALSHFRISSEYQSAARLVVPLAGATVAVSLLGGVFGGVLAGLQRFDLLNGIEVGMSGLRAIAIVWSLKSGYGIRALALIQFCSSLASTVTYVLLGRRLYPHLRVHMADINRKRLQLIFYFSAYSFLLQIFASLILYTDAVVISLYLPVSLVTFFAIGGNLISYARALVAGISQLMTPLASSLQAGGDEEGLRRALLDGTRYGTCLMMPICLTFMLRGSTFIGLWMGSQYADLSGRVLWVLAFSGLFSAGIQVAWGIILGLGRHRALVPVSLVEALANLGLSIFLVQRSGVVGVAWGTTLPNVLVCLLFWPVYLNRSLDVPLGKFCWNTWLRPGIALVPFGLASYVLDRWWTAQNLLAFLAQVALALPLAAIGVWFLCIPERDRRAYSIQARTFIRGAFSQV
jgi:O-antigen/teichoic acid export membrane protein